ncbi:acyltransferase family protein [Planctomycetaceae bacterium SH139]
MRLDRFKRKTTSGAYLAEIDGLRFVAIFSVIMVHLSGIWRVNVGRTYAGMNGLDRALAGVFSLGGYGVELFFIISGFVLALPFCKQYLQGGKPVCLKKYALRRLTRLEPPYVVSMLAFFAVMPWVGKGDYASLFNHLVASLLYVHNLVYFQGSLINNNAWSLEIEIQFYILVPIILLALAWRSIHRHLVFLFAFCVFSTGSLLIPSSWPKTVLDFAQYFLAGVIICEFWLTGWQSQPRSRFFDLLGIACVVLFFGLHLLGNKELAKGITPVLLSGVVVSALRGPLVGNALSWGFVPIVGGMCYSIYLIHARVLSLILTLLFARLGLTGSYSFDIFLLSLVCLPVVVLCSLIFFIAIERPCMDPDWPQKFHRASLSTWRRMRGVKHPHEQSPEVALSDERAN